jgi:DNA-binding NarL/FixJ family response regulator
MSRLLNLSDHRFDDGDPVREKPQAAFSAKQWAYLQSRYHLTPRERQIAGLACRGCKNSDIAEDLHISGGTAKTHTRNIYRKVRVKSKTEMLYRFLTDLGR